MKSLLHFLIVFVRFPYSHVNAIGMSYEFFSDNVRFCFSCLKQWSFCKCHWKGVAPRTFRVWWMWWVSSEPGLHRGGWKIVLWKGLQQILCSSLRYLQAAHLWGEYNGFVHLLWGLEITLMGRGGAKVDLCQWLCESKIDHLDLQQALNYKLTANVKASVWN